MSVEHPESTQWGMTRKEYEDRKYLVFKLRNQGLSYRAIGEQVGVSGSRALAIHQGNQKQKKKRKLNNPLFFKGASQSG